MWTLRLFHSKFREPLMIPWSNSRMFSHFLLLKQQRSGHVASRLSFYVPSTSHWTQSSSSSRPSQAEGAQRGERRTRSRPKIRALLSSSSLGHRKDDRRYFQISGCWGGALFGQFCLQLWVPHVFSELVQLSPGLWVSVDLPQRSCHISPSSCH